MTSSPPSRLKPDAVKTLVVQRIDTHRRLPPIAFFAVVGVPLVGVLVSASVPVAYND